MVLSKLEDDRHPRVWCATIYAIWQLVMKSSFHLQDECHRVLPALAEAMDDFQNPRVQTDAIVAVIRFSDYCDVSGYLGRTIGSSLVLLQEFKWWRPKSRLLYLRDIYLWNLSQAWARLCKCPRRDLSP